MPRTARNEQEIDEIKDTILNHALDIINNEGFDGLTMRELGSRINCASKTIYNYYRCKEDIYLQILIRGFEILNAKADQAINDESEPLEQLRILCNIYIDFGLENVHYYNLMFSWDVPKYTNYIGTFFESAAQEEKAVAMHYAVITEAAISKVLSKKGTFSKTEIAYHLVRMWSVLHGFVALHNSYSFREYYPNTLRFRRQIVDELLERFN